ncbi:PepSY-associated TM helix domain-containing protein [Parasphingorhabdus litoris]|uniref:PepSY-associated TM helix domain-containing protein n=1 Tax=Parasphingorhabdus litoris TaxID=394733 RepID=UPI0031DB5066
MLAIIFGGLIYILAVTGTLSVFNHELQRWEQPNAPEMQSISAAAAERAAYSVFRSEAVPTTHLYVTFPRPDLPRTVITTDTQAFFADEDGNIVAEETFPWTQFLLDLHYYLHMPQILGLTIVGALGIMLIGLSLSGILAHPRIFRDAFTFRRGAGRLTTVDLHNRLSVWTLPFHFSNALTGSILGVASVLAFAIAAAGFDGDTEQVFAPIFGSEPAPNSAPADIATIAKPIQHIEENFPDIDPTYFIMHDPGTAGQNSQIVGEHGDRLIFGDYYTYDASGNYNGNVGISDGTIGQQIIGSVYNVHFGNWGGLPVKLAYLLFGIGLCVIVASGLKIYFAKRRDKGNSAPRLEGAWTAIIWGTPAALALTLVIALADVVPESGLVALFWLSLVAMITYGSRIGSTRIKPILLVATGMLLTLAMFAHAVRYKEAVISSAGLPISLSLFVLAIAAFLQASLGRKNAHAKQGIMFPAE